MKTQLATDGNWHIAAVSVPVPGSVRDKKLCDQLQTLERLPTSCEAAADKGYQGLVTDTVSTLSTRDVETGVEKKVPRSLLILLIVMVILRFYFIISEQVFFFFLAQSSHKSTHFQPFCKLLKCLNEKFNHWRVLCNLRHVRPTFRTPIIENLNISKHTFRQAT